MLIFDIRANVVHMFTFRTSRNCFWQIQPNTFLSVPNSRKIVYFIRVTLYRVHSRMRTGKIPIKWLCTAKNGKSYLNCATFLALETCATHRYYSLVIIQFLPEFPSLRVSGICIRFRWKFDWIHEASNIEWMWKKIQHLTNFKFSSK